MMTATPQGRPRASLFWLWAAALAAAMALSASGCKSSELDRVERSAALPRGAHRGRFGTL
jgi:hypothetical protein